MNYASLYTNVSLIPCPVRMVVIVAIVSHPKDDEHTVYSRLCPVVAIQQYEQRQYGNHRGLDEYGTHREMLEAGWRFIDQAVNHTAVYHDLWDGYGTLCVYDDDAPGFRGVADHKQLCYCPWPESEDAQRLADERKWVEQEALDKYRRKRESQAKAG